MTPERLHAVPDSLETLGEAADGAVVARVPGTPESSSQGTVLFLPRRPEDGRRERERLVALAGPGIPNVRLASADGSEVIEYVGSEGARPLGAGTEIADAAWRPTLSGLLSALARGHGHGWGHARIAAGNVFAEPGGRAWIRGWGGAQELSGRILLQTGIDAVGRDLRDLGVVLVRALARVPDPDAAAGPVGSELLDRARSRARTFDPELARVVARLVTLDPRESYLDASEVLTDLGETDPSVSEPWEEMRLVGRGKLMRRLTALLTRTAAGDATDVGVRISGPARSGRTRVLDELSRVARERGLVVVQSGGGAGHSPWGAIGAIARQLVSRLAEDDPLRGDPAIRGLVGDAPLPVPSGADRAGAGDRSDDALLRLAEQVFRQAAGVILLDDEDALSRHARDLWRDLARHAVSVATDSEPIRVLLISTAVSGPEEEPDAPHVVVESIGELGRREVASALGGLLTDRGSALPLADEVLAHTGGLPGDVSALLRDMVMRGTLQPVGRRLAPQRAGSGTVRLPDAPRDPHAGATRDAVALASVLAVAGPLRLPRASLAEIAGIDTVRLAAAAESAIRANLIARDGATWRIRTESVRLRTERSMPDERRRSVHREILQFLLDANPRDQVKIAHHARGAGDPRAVEWTHAALRILRDAGRFGEAASHFEDARVALPAGALDLDLRVEQIDSMFRSGRLGAGIRLATEVRSDPAATPLQRGRATLALAWLYRYDQSWTRVLSLDLPQDCGDGRVLGEMRAVRAHALMRLGRAADAAREERLALAEAIEPADVEAVRYALLDMKASDFGDVATLREAYACLLRRIRIARRRGDDVHVALDLIRAANLRRNMDDQAGAHAVLRRAEAWCASRQCMQPFVACWLANARTGVLVNSDRFRAAECEIMAAAVWADRTGGTAIAAVAQFRVATSQCRLGRLTARRYSWLRTWAESADERYLDVAPGASGECASTLALCGLHRALTEIRRRCSESPSLAGVRRKFEYWTVTSSIYLAGLRDWRDGDTIDSAAIRSVELESREFIGSITGPDPHLRPNGLSRRAVSVAVTVDVVLRGQFGTESWPSEWNETEIAGLIREQPCGWVNGNILAAALVVAARRAMSADLRDVVDRAVRTLDGQFPTALEWLRSLALARVRYESGQLVAALAFMDEAKRLVEVLDRPESGDLGPAARFRAQVCIERYGVRVRRSEPLAVVVLPPVTARIAWAEWDAALHSALAGRRTLVVCEDRAERDLLLRAIDEAVAGLAPPDRPRVVPLETGTPDGSGAEPDDTRVLVVASLGGPEDPKLVARASQVCGSIVRVPSPLDRPGGRAWLFRRIARVAGIPLAPPDADLDREVEEYPWPGGAGEMRSLAGDLHAGGCRELRRSSLDAVGWNARRAIQALAPAHPLEPGALTYLAAHPGSSTGDVAASLGCSTRTAIRVLSRLVEEGVVACVGRGRATRYSPARASRAPRVVGADVAGPATPSRRPA